MRGLLRGRRRRDSVLLSGRATILTPPHTPDSPLPLFLPPSPSLPLSPSLSLSPPPADPPSAPRQGAPAGPRALRGLPPSRPRSIKASRLPRRRARTRSSVCQLLPVLDAAMPCPHTSAGPGGRIHQPGRAGPHTSAGPGGPAYISRAGRALASNAVPARSVAPDPKAPFGALWSPGRIRVSAAAASRPRTPPALRVRPPLSPPPSLAQIPPPADSARQGPAMCRFGPARARHGPARSPAPALPAGRSTRPASWASPTARAWLGCLSVRAVRPRARARAHALSVRQRRVHAPGRCGWRARARLACSPGYTGG